MIIQRWLGRIVPCAVACLLSSGPTLAEHALYRPPRLDNGRPDLQGGWEHTDLTPLVRPAGTASLVITPAQAAEIERIVEGREEDRTTPTEPTDFFNKRRIQPIRGELHSSIIVDPEDGQLPGTLAFREWQSTLQFNTLNAMDGPEQRPTSERCLGNPASQPPNLHNPGTNLHQIVQTDDAVVFIAEWMNDARIIRLSSQHAPSAAKSWLGDSIGWWEADTLVVETTQFSPSDSGRVAAGVNFRISPSTRVVERITRVSDDELNYAFTVEDPALYTRAWKGETHFMRTNDRILEYACHEANYSLRFILQGARQRDEHSVNSTATAAKSSPTITAK